MHYLLIGEYPFYEKNHDIYYRRLLTEVLHFEYVRAERLSPSAKDLLSHMLQRNPAVRFTASQVLSHPWLS